VEEGMSWVMKTMHILDRIDEESGREHAAPIIVADRSGDHRRAGSIVTAKPRPKPTPAFSASESADAVLRQVAAAGQMVRRHQRQASCG
jgi:hypothetical protein